MGFIGLSPSIDFMMCLSRMKREVAVVLRVLRQARCCRGEVLCSGRGWSCMAKSLWLLQLVNWLAP
jgi:hypothetical protein